MLAKDFDPEQPVWVLYGPRAWGPFKVAMRAVNHVTVHVPSDKRLWVDAERVKPSKMGRTLETFPLSCVTQDVVEVINWNELNEPKVGDLISIKVRHREWDKQRQSPLIRDTTVEGVVYSDTGHQVQIMCLGGEANDYTRFHHYTKDSCFVITKGGSHGD